MRIYFQTLHGYIYYAIVAPLVSGFSQMFRTKMITSCAYKLIIFAKDFRYVSLYHRYIGYFCGGLLQISKK